MNTAEALERPLARSGELSRGLVSIGLITLREAADHIERLPYMRTSAPDPRLVLTERRGTCSTKHAAFTLLCREADVACRLRVAAFEMSGRVVPRVAHVLEAAGLEAILEAHCFVEVDSAAIDLTGIEDGEASPEYLQTADLDPLALQQKVAIHQSWLRSWGEANAPGRPFEQLWDIRERCIAAIGRQDRPDGA